eukprot:SAG22_NODE_5865_length_939_cov_3.054762_1_plen_76_part_00
MREFLLDATRSGAGGGVVAQKVDISQLEGLDVPEGLKEIIGGMYAEASVESLCLVLRSRGEWRPSASLTAGPFQK